MPLLFKYNIDICNINNCNDSVHEHFMCKKHCNQYITDDTIKEISNNIESLNSGKASLILKVKKFLQSVFHYTTNIPMLYEEHFPLEHVFLYHMNRLRGTKDTKHSEMLKKLIKDFDIEPNENIDYVKNTLSHIILPKKLIKGDYLLSKKELPNRYILLISLLLTLLLFFFYYKSSLHMYIDDSMMSLIPVFVKYSALYLFVILLWGEGFIYLYNNLSTLAMDNKLFKEKDNNRRFLIDIKLIKDRRKKTNSYTSSIIGAIIGLVTITSIFIIKHSTFSLESWYLIVPLILLFNSVIFIILFYYNTLVLFFPIIQSFAKKEIFIRIYNPDCVGGTSIYQKYLFRCFIFNEAILTISFLIMRQLPIIICIILFFILERRMNHAGRCIFLYTKLLIEIKREKKQELEKLYDKNTATSFRNAELLKKVTPSLIMKSTKRFISIIVIPFIISIAANMIFEDKLKDILSVFIEAIK